MALPNELNILDQKTLSEWKCNPVTIALFKYWTDYVSALFADVQRRINDGDVVSEKEQNNIYVIKSTLDKLVLNIQYDNNFDGKYKAIVDLYEVKNE